MHMIFLLILPTYGQASITVWLMQPQPRRKRPYFFENSLKLRACWDLLVLSFKRKWSCSWGPQGLLR